MSRDMMGSFELYQPDTVDGAVARSGSTIAPHRLRYLVGPADWSIAK